MSENESSVSEASDAREPGELSDQAVEVMAVAEESAVVSAKNRTATEIKRDMAATCRARRGGVQSDDAAIARAAEVAEGDAEE